MCKKNWRLTFLEKKNRATTKKRQLNINIIIKKKFQYNSIEKIMHILTTLLAVTQCFRFNNCKCNMN